jgi:hypothetical protein
MKTKDFIKTAYVVSAWTSYGIRQYLSVMGFNLGNDKHYIWEVGIENAREFSSKKEAKTVAQKAIADFIGGKTYIINQYRIRTNGSFEMKAV